MEPLLILAIGGVAALALKKRQAQLPAQQPPPSTALVPAQPTLPEVKAPNLEGIVSKETKDTIVDIVKGAGAVLVGAGAGYVASEGGRELDKLLGGDGKGATALVLRVGLGGTAWVGVTLTAFAVLKVFAVTATTILNATGIGLLITVAAFFIVAGIDDLNRLAYAEAGKHWGELYKERDTALDTMRNQLRRIRDEAAGVRDALAGKSGGDVRRLNANDLADYQRAVEAAGINDTQIERFAVEMAMAYVAERNLNRFNAWMKRSWGLGVSAAYHARFGRDRGYFCGDVDVSGFPKLALFRTTDEDPETREFPTTGTSQQGVALYNQEWVLAHVPASERASRNGTRPHTVPIIERVPVATVPKVVTGKGIISTAALKDYKLATGDGKTIEKIVGYRTEQEPYTFYWDRTQGERFTSGRLLANVMSFAEHMKDQPGLGVNSVDHAKAGEKEGKFHGRVNDQGRLEYGVPLVGGGVKTVVIDFRDGIVG